MSDFNYPIQVDSSHYVKTAQDINYNKIFNKIFIDSSIKSILNKIRIELKLGIESNLLNEGFYYVVLLDYFDSLFEFYKKATIEEKQTFYTKFIKCLETNSICRSNPKLIRYLSEIIKFNFDRECGLNYLDEFSSYYSVLGNNYILQGFNSNLFSEQFCFFYKTSTFVVNYNEYSFEDLDVRDPYYSYNFKNKSLLIIGKGRHFFNFNRKINRTIFFLLDFRESVVEVNKQLNIKFTTYIGDTVTSDVNNIDLGTVAVDHSSSYSNKAWLLSYTISYNSSTDITSFVTTTQEITNLLSPVTLP